MRAFFIWGFRVYQFRANLASGQHYKDYEGRVHLVVPVVMLRETVVNGAFVAAVELEPEAWNGVPVTVGHPVVEGTNVSANHPQILSAWHVGRIFNAHMMGDKLKAEAWIDVERAETVHPGLVALIESGEPLEVSTGYFSDAEEVEGTHDGKPYTHAHHNLRPDHLALLPGDVGACNWQDGCGVRANSKKGPIMSKVKDALGVIANALKISEQAETPVTNCGCKERREPTLGANARGSDTDRRQTVADLISSDATPFLPDDMWALMDMGDATLKALREQYLTEQKEPVANSGAGDNVEGSDVSEPTAGAPALSDDDRKALEFARNQYAEHKASLISRITANSNMTAEQVQAMDVATLEVVANGLKAPADYSGRGAMRPTVNNADESAAAMAAGVGSV